MVHEPSTINHSANMDSIGEILREARHNKKASLEDAARVTKIKLDVLEKLESDEFDRLAAPMYTKGFLKLYAEYLGLDSQEIVDTYVRSQGGLRRQGLQVETEATARKRKPPELHLPLRRVVWVVMALTAAVLAGLLIVALVERRPAPSVSATQTPPQLPKADFDAYYQPKTKPAPELLELPK
jgi:cytoskeleton protein RodZ